MKMYEGVEVYLHSLNECEWIASRPAAMSSRKEAPVPTGQEAGWASEPVRTLQESRRISASAWDRVSVMTEQCPLASKKSGQLT
jgi:hypothetical protein